MDVREKKHIAEHFALIEVQSREISKVKIPEGCVRVRFLDKEEIIINGNTFYGSPKNVSGWYYWGTKLPLKEVKGKISSEQYYHLEFDGRRYVVITKEGSVFGLNADDIVIPA